MSHPLLTAPADLVQIQASLQVPPFPVGGCLSSLDDLRDWLQRAQFSLETSGLKFGYTVGAMEAAVPEDRDRPRFMFDEHGRFLGMALWMPDLQGWTIPGQVGQLMAVRRIATTVEDDLKARPLAGWKLCDGTSPALPNLTVETTVDVYNTANPPAKSGTVKVPSQWFAGTGPNWDTYTVGYVGAAA